MEKVVQFVECSGLLHGRIPSPQRQWCEFDFVGDVYESIGFAKHPAHIVAMDIWLSHPKRVCKTPFIGGISVGRVPAVYVPDMLLGFIDVSGRWHWPLRESCVFCNLHDCNARILPPPTEAWPVWFTCTYKPMRDMLVMRRRHFDATIQMRRRVCARFWNAALEEFIQKTWAPSRLTWCLDHEEIRDIGL